MAGTPCSSRLTTIKIVLVVVYFPIRMGIRAVPIDAGTLAAGAFVIAGLASIDWLSSSEAFFFCDEVAG